MAPVSSIAEPVPTAAPQVRGAPPPLRGGPLALYRFMRDHGMLSLPYARLIARWLWLKLRFRGRLKTDGLCFVCPGVTIEIGRDATLHLGRWSWIGHGSKIRVHEGEAHIGAKSVLGQECTISAFQHVSIGRECIIADRVMLIDFDHGVVEVERPIRAQGIYKRDVRVGHNVWIGYGVAILRGVTVGDNSVLGTSTIVSQGRAGERRRGRRAGARHPHAQGAADDALGVASARRRAVPAVTTTATPTPTSTFAPRHSAIARRRDARRLRADRDRLALGQRRDDDERRQQRRRHQPDDAGRPRRQLAAAERHRPERLDERGHERDAGDDEPQLGAHGAGSAAPPRARPARRGSPRAPGCPPA